MLYTLATTETMSDMRLCDLILYLASLIMKSYLWKLLARRKYDISVQAYVCLKQLFA